MLILSRSDCDKSTKDIVDPYSTATVDVQDGVVVWTLGKYHEAQKIVLRITDLARTDMPRERNITGFVFAALSYEFELGHVYQISMIFAGEEVAMATHKCEADE